MTEPLKAYTAYPGDSQIHDGCVLVYARSHAEARHMAWKSGLWQGESYIDFRARRTPAFDQYAKGEKPYTVETNEGLEEMFYLEDPQGKIP